MSRMPHQCMPLAGTPGGGGAKLIIASQKLTINLFMPEAGSTIAWDMNGKLENVDIPRM